MNKVGAVIVFLKIEKIILNDTKLFHKKSINIIGIIIIPIILMRIISFTFKPKITSSPGVSSWTFSPFFTLFFMVIPYFGIPL